MSIGLTACTTSTQSGVTRYSLDLNKVSFETIADFDSPVGPGTLRRGRIDNNYYVSVGPDQPHLIQGATAADLHLVVSQRVGAAQAVVFAGSTPACPVKYVLLMANSDRRHMLGDIGDCRTPLAFSFNNQQFFAFDAQAPDPRYWVFENHQSHGPILKSALFAPSKPKTPPPVQAKLPPAAPAVPGLHQQQPHPETASAPPGVGQAQAPTSTDQAPSPPPPPAKHQMLQAVSEANVPSEVLVKASGGKNVPTVVLVDDNTTKPAP